jgi:diguanylate cyclase (GGDEF)-like protein
MLVRFWGTRGSTPTPGPGTTRFGGNTSCVEARADDGNIFVFDCGTGIREFGLSLLSESLLPPRIHILIGHTHWDHIQGFPFFTPVFLPGTEINIYAPLGFQRSLEDAMAGQMQYSYFPVKLGDLASRIHYTELDEGVFRVGSCLVETQYLNHTAPTIGYRLTEGPTSVAYITDHEPFWKNSGKTFEHPGDQRHVEFIRGVDLLIHDAQYSDEEYETKVGWGHSPLGYVGAVAAAGGVRRVALFHHDPTHDDEWVERAAAGMRDTIRAEHPDIEVFAAAERSAIELHGDGDARRVARDSALHHRSVVGQRVLIVSRNRADTDVVEHTLVDDGLIVMLAPDAETAMKRAAEFTPSLAIIDQDAVDDAIALARRIRMETAYEEMPVILLARGGTGRTAPMMDDRVDYIERPFGLPMLRSRVRAWVARTAGQRVVVSESDPVSWKDRNQGSAGDRDDAAVLARTRLFGEMPTHEIEALVSSAGEQTFPPGYPIIREGERGSAVYIVMSGKVRVMEALRDGPADMLLGEFGAGELFGELGFLRDAPRTASVVTLEPTRCLSLPQAEFLAALENSPSLAIALLRVLAGRLIAADRMLARHAPDPLTGLPVQGAFRDLYQRLAAGARRRGTGVLLMLIDIDNLRAINDGMGYTLGDEILKATGEALVEASRATDLISRHGGDDFAVLMIDTDTRHAEGIATRVGEKLKDLARQRGWHGVVHYDVGIAIADQPPENLESLFRQADEDQQARKLQRTR